MKKIKLILFLLTLCVTLCLLLLILEYKSQQKIKEDIKSWSIYLEQEKIIVNGIQDYSIFDDKEQEFIAVGIEFRGNTAEALFDNRLDLLCQHALQAENSDTHIPVKYETLKIMALLKMGYKRYQIRKMPKAKEDSLLKDYQSKYWYALYDYYFKKHDYHTLAKRYFKAPGVFSDFYEEQQDKNN
jgi:hypothetical protein